MKQNLLKNKVLFWLGLIHLLLGVALTFYSFYNETIVLGINAMLKPIKFALSIWIYSWTMAFILNYLEDVRKVKIYSWIAVLCMGFEQLAITFQALRGELSHFNNTDTFGKIVFTLMGIFILIITFWTVSITIAFFKQKIYGLHPTIVLGIKIGLVYFIIFSFFGGYISGMQGHTVGSADGGEGLLFINWSTFFGDLRVAHFFGLHSLQIIPLVAIFSAKYLNRNTSLYSVKIFSVSYLIFVVFTATQAINGLPFLK